MDLLSIARNYFYRYRGNKEIQKLLRLAKKVPRQADTVLFWVPGGMSLMLEVEGAIALALKLRGYNVQAVICDGAFHACVKREIGQETAVGNWQDSCKACKAENRAVLDMLGIAYTFIGDYVDMRTRFALRRIAGTVTWASLENLSHRDINVGRNVRSSIMRYLKGVDFIGDNSILQEYAYSGLLSAESAISAIDCVRPSRVFMSHGTYVDWGPALRVALTRNIPVIAWMASYLKGRFYFRHIDDIDHIDFHNLSDKAWAHCRKSNLGRNQRARLDKFLADRYQQQISFDMKHFKGYLGDVDLLRERYGLTNKLPIWGIMSHINWDAVSDYAPMAYDTFDDWVLDTVNEIINIPNIQWLIKIHPAEAWDNPDSGAHRLIQKNFASLPSHIKIVSAADDISPLDFFNLVDGGVTVYGTPGLELALLGKPVILAGEAYYGGKGFTHDGTCPESYTQLLRKAASLGPLNEEQQRLARNYAYCYFIQRQIPLRVVEDPTTEWWKFQFDKSHLLLAGEDPFVDFICDRIVDGRDFVMGEELVRLAELPDDDCGAIGDENAVLSMQSLETVEGK